MDAIEEFKARVRELATGAFNLIIDVGRAADALAASIKPAPPKFKPGDLVKPSTSGPTFDTYQGVSMTVRSMLVVEVDGEWIKVLRDTPPKYPRGIWVRARDIQKEA